MLEAESIHLRSGCLTPGGGPFIVGILNLTPDSFSDGGAYPTQAAAVEAGCKLAAHGADVIDVGGESTRPGSVPVPIDEQIRRVAPVIAALAGHFGRRGPAISIDTRSSRVAHVALQAGATIINDISAMRDDPAMGELAASTGAALVLMHMQGSPADMQRNPQYRDVTSEVRDFLAERINAAVAAGVPRSRIIADPGIGIGFGKSSAHNLQLLRRIAELRTLDVPLLVGPSRKRFIGEILGIDAAADRDIGTCGAVAAVVLAGVECVRVHNVQLCRQVVEVCKAIRNARSADRL